MTEHTHPDSRPRDSFAAAAAALSRLGRLRDLPVILMLAWVGWLAIPWPFSGLAQARGTADQSLSAGASADRVLSAGASADRALGIGASTGQATGTAVSAARGPARPALLVKTAQAALSPRELIASERARIAEEVHDAAGHGLATIAMQAGVALLMLDERPDQARESLEAIRSTSMKALSQLRSALDLIDPTTSDHDLPALIHGVRAAGLPVDVEPAEPQVPAHLEGTVYRVVRESLTNVLRHAGPTRALVRVANDPCVFVLEIADRGSGLSGTAEGRGLAGMRTRVTEAGGLFSAGPREGGGFQVMARFPRASRDSGSPVAEGAA
ncbi:sensor histidine kinase [Streptosporangium album]|uniref:sensor histidine kinase n=1 Tax=Streptosporangium album TaxID=47479 RepID=UPI0031EFDF16